jgi:hypothetical protein
VHSKANNYQNQETTYRVVENFCSLDKGLQSRIYKRLQKLNTISTNNPINKWANELNRQFSKEVAIGEMQIKLSLRFHFTPVGVGSSKNSYHQENNCW